MDSNTAQIVLYVIAAVAAIVWLIALQFVLAGVQARKQRLRDAGQRFDAGGQDTSTLVCGSLEVDGQPRDLSAKVAAALASGQILGPVKVDKEDQRVSFERTGAEMSGGLAVGPLKGQFQFHAMSATRTVVDYAVSLSRLRLWLGLAFGLLALGLIALVAGFWALNTYVVASPMPNVRGQAFQMAQVTHFLWPPFMFGVLYRRMDRGLHTALDTFIHNLTFVKT